MQRFHGLSAACVLVVAALAAGCTPTPTASSFTLPVHDISLASQQPPYKPASSAAGGQAIAKPVKPAVAIAATPARSADWEPADAPRAWKYIVIHHSATENGSAATIDAAHRARGWDELGYHFVIDNGAGGPDGRVEVGPRWKSQKWGAHTGNTPNNEYNNVGIGICVVGNYGSKLPSAAQLESLQRLVCYLSAKYDIPPSHIIGHRDAPNAKTECPGDSLWTYVHNQLRAECTRRLASK